MLQNATSLLKPSRKFLPFRSSMPFRLFKLINNATDALENFASDSVAEYSTKNKRTLKKFKKQQCSTLETVTSGEYVKITGKIEPAGDHFTAPFSGKKGIYLHVNVTREDHDETTTLIEEEKGFDFYLSSNGRKALVRYRGATTHVEGYKRFRSGLLRNPTPAQEQYLADHRVKSSSFGLNKKLTFSEGIIELTDTVTVLGKGNWTETEAGERLFEISHDDEQPLLISNKIGI